jgi:hypothetical protein
MTSRYGLILSMAALALGGCLRPDPTVELLEGEMRWLEDQLYLAEAEFQKTSDQLASCRLENQRLRQSGPTGERDTSGRERTTPAEPRVPPTVAPDLQPSLAPPEVHEGEPIEPEIEPPAPADQEPDMNVRPSSGTVVVDDFVDAQVNQIVFTSHFIGNIEGDDQQGEKGLLVVVEPRNASGQYVALPGPVSVVVLDRSKTGADARVARWDVDAAQTAQSLKATLFGRGIHLELPWPDGPPQSDELRVYARYITVDGRKLDAHQDLQVTSVRPAGTWTPASKAPTSGTAQSELSHSVGSPLPRQLDTVRAGADRSAVLSPPDRSDSPRAKRRRPTWRPYR